MEIDKSTRNTSTLVDGCEELGIRLSGRQTDQFVRYYEMLTEKNKVMNLTAVTKWEEVLTRHFLDSLLVCRVTDLQTDSLKVLDLGTGAGFPGVPLKIAFPQLSITLADSLNKRIGFLDDVIRDLQLGGIQTVHARAEDLGHRPEYRQQYDLVVSRAVANLASLSEYCLPFVRRGGLFIAYKSTNIDTEYQNSLRAVRLLGGKPEGITTLPLPHAGLERSFAVVRKVSDTAQKYPRKAGVPSRSPL